MMIKRILLFVLAQCFAFTLFAQPAHEFPKSKDGMLSLLDQLLERRHIHVARRRAKADSIRDIIRNSQNPAELPQQYLSLGVVESELSTDSAIIAFNRGIAASELTGDSVAKQRMEILQSWQFFCGGMMHEGLNQLDSLNSRLYPENEHIYHKTRAITLITLGAFYEYSPIDDANMKLARGSAARWVELAESGSADQLFGQGLLYACDRKYQLMASTFHDCVDRAVMTDPEYSRALIMLGEYFWSIGSLDEAAYNYALSAVANIYNANLEGVALLRLGELLYTMNDARRSHNYLAISLEKALQANEKFNLMRLNNAYMEVAKAVDSQRHQWIYMLCALIMVLLVLLGFVLKMMRDKKLQVANLKRTEQRLASANLAKETYISEFMNLSSSYIEIIEEYNKFCMRKLQAKQTTELMSFIKSGKVFEDARRKFYDVFDAALLHIFPDFVEQVNILLQPDKKIVTEPTVLTTELRVAAMTRLGIDDVSVIARFLGISPNTIYTYRNKLRTRAIDRSTLDDDIRRIGTV